MSDLLIPFGLHKITGEIVEPEDVVSGRACDCICPGCKAPILARHPKVNRSHFAHDSKHENAKPEEECPFSSAVAVAMMIREVASLFVGKVLYTPSYECLLEFDCCFDGATVVQVCDSAYMVIDEVEVGVFEFSRRFDIKFSVAGIPVYVDLIHKGKLPVTLFDSELDEAGASILELDCDSFVPNWARKDKAQRFSEAVTEFVLEWGLRRWSLHSSQAQKVKSVKNAHQCKSYYESNDYITGHVPEASRVEEAMKLRARIEAELSAERKDLYLCLKCKEEWLHTSNQQPNCPNCHTHLFARKL